MKLVNSFGNWHIDSHSLVLPDVLEGLGASLYVINLATPEYLEGVLWSKSKYLFIRLGVYVSFEHRVDYLSAQNLGSISYAWTIEEEVNFVSSNMFVNVMDF